MVNIMQIDAKKSLNIRHTRLVLLTLAVCISCPVHAVLKEIPESEMSDIRGQAVFYTDYVAPGESGNTNAVDGSTTPNVGFFRFGLNATMDLNASIQHLQLGCGGVNGAGCDIDISNLSLTGVNAGSDGSYASSDAIITNPFIELAIKDPNSLSTRTLEGFRLGAFSILGRLSIGTNTNTTTTTDDTGIKSLSGNLTVNIVNGVLNNVNIGGIATTTATVASYTSTQSLGRASTITLDNISATTGTVKLGGVLPTISGLTLSNVTVANEPLSSVHNLLLANTDGTATSDAYLSLQQTALTWQTLSTGKFDTTTTAQTGWWLSLPSVTISNLSSNSEIDVPLLTALTGTLGTKVTLAAFDLGQTPVQNCYGGLKFC